MLLLAKFFGECNEVKRLMDLCFKEEKEIKRRENMIKAREEEAKFQRMLDKLDGKQWKHRTHIDVNYHWHDHLLISDILQCYNLLWVYSYSLHRYNFLLVDNY